MSVSMHGTIISTKKICQFGALIKYQNKVLVVQYWRDGDELTTLA